MFFYVEITIKGFYHFIANYGYGVIIMSWSRKTTKPYKEIFMEHINNGENYLEIKKTYNYIKKDYINRIMQKTIDINIERASLERDINNGKVLSVPNYLSFTLLAITIFITGMIATYNKYPNVTIVITIISSIFVVYAGFSISLYLSKDDKKVIVFKLCLRVLDDIEKEMAEEQIVIKEKADKLEKQQKIEEYFIRGRFINNLAPALNEIAVGLVSKVFKKNK